MCLSFYVEYSAADVSQFYKLVLVDEWQDTNAVQYDITQMLAAHGNITIVGDEDQSIYAWRGADVSNLRKFMARYSPTVHLLTENYRSSSACVQASSLVIRQCQEARTEKELCTRNSSCCPVSVLMFSNQGTIPPFSKRRSHLSLEAECRRIVTEIQALSYHDIVSLE